MGCGVGWLSGGGKLTSELIGDRGGVVDAGSASLRWGSGSDEGEREVERKKKIVYHICLIP